MFKNKIFLLGFVLVLLSQVSVGQNNTNSPYTRFGYGEISDTNSGEQRAMGGVALGSRSKIGINVVNPASYSAVDSMTFMFDVGVSALVSRFSETGGTTNKLNANLEYITMQFPLWKKVGFSAGLLPYSFSGYNFYSTTNLPIELYPDTVTATQSFIGNGGISQLYGGLSVELFNHISLGVNAYYMFGSSINSRLLTFSSSDFYSSLQRDSIVVSSLRFRYGVQLYNTFAKKHDVSLGLIYEPKLKLNADYSEMTGSVDQEATPYKDVFSSFEVPELFGVGLNYVYNKQLTLGLDYSMQKWGDAKFFGVTDSLSNRSKLAIGAEFIPSLRGRRYYEVVRYRVGFNVSDPYYKLANEKLPQNYGITFGMGLPLRNNRSVINTTFEYGKIGSIGLLREDYFKFTLSASLNETWFMKRKL